MEYSILKGASYVLVHAPDMVLYGGTCCSMETRYNKDFPEQSRKFLRRYENTLTYMPNQVYIGNLNPCELKKHSLPWYNKSVEGKRFGKFGEIMPQDEFIAFLKMCDAFDLVILSKEFTRDIKPKLLKHRLIRNLDIRKLKEGLEINDIQNLIDSGKAVGVYNEGELVGCVKRAHDTDINLNSQIVLSNLGVKASGALAVMHLLKKLDTSNLDIDYVIECSEEACGDMNQRGGGNFAKAIAEVVGLKNATGCDIRGFCAGPTHAIIQASALVNSGVYNNVVVVSGGSIAKLGLNMKDHIENNMPILEDVLGGFAVLISKNDGISPKIRTDLIGKHTVGTGSSPQAMITSLIGVPLDKAKLKITDIDIYSAEMQNPDITRVTGTGDIPLANYKMIAHLGVKRDEIQSDEMDEFIETHGLRGWAPTQGHIPSGIPYIGFAIENLVNGNIKRAMVIGKGSLFLGRMTNLFDGISVLLEHNDGKIPISSDISTDDINKMIAKAMKNLAAEILKDSE